MREDKSERMCYNGGEMSEGVTDMESDQLETAREISFGPGDVLRELAAIGFASPARLLGPDGQVDPQRLASADLAAVAAIEATKGGVKLKYYDKLKALELLGKHFGVFDGTGQQAQAQNNLLDLLAGSGEEEHALHQLQFETAADHDLVEREEGF